MPRSKRNLLFILVLACCSFLGCEKQPDRWEAAQEASSKNPVAVATDAVAGSEFNRCFPQVQAPWDIVFKQEKAGLAQASLQKDGVEVAVLSITDTKNNPDALEKFKGSERKLAEHTLAAVGSQGTALLVADRFQVQIRSQTDDFPAAEREEWLNKFDLAALAKLR